MFKCDALTIGFIEGEDGESGLGLSGQLDILAEIEDGYTVDRILFKVFFINLIIILLFNLTFI